MTIVKIKKGYDVRMTGAAERVVEDAPRPNLVSVRPVEFRGLKPKILVRAGQTVSLGEPLFHDKTRPEVRFVSPAGGEVADVVYGRRRVCQQIHVRVADEEPAVPHTAYSASQAQQLARAQIVELLLDSGMWTSLRRRPYSTIPDAETVPEAIFISASDSSPLPYDPSLALDGREVDFQLGVDVLRKLTEGKVYLCTARGGGEAKAFAAANVERVEFAGPYPSGQIEVQIHHVLPYKKGREVWYLECQDVAGIGELFRTGRYPVQKVVAVGGEAVHSRRHVRTRRGVSPALLTGGDVDPGRVRYVSGNLFQGLPITYDCGLGHYDTKICVLPEGDEPEFIGWMKPGFGKLSRYRAFASAMLPPKEPKWDTALAGGVRAHVATGIYEEVCAVGILPAYLMKSILAGEVEESEALGLHDCAECGLCTYVCPSKIEFADIIRGGLDEFMKEEE